MFISLAIFRFVFAIPIIPLQLYTKGHELLENAKRRFFRKKLSDFCSVKFSDQRIGGEEALPR